MDFKDKQDSLKMEECFIDDTPVVELESDDESYMCYECSATFATKSGILVHITNQHRKNEQSHICVTCKMIFENKDELLKHSKSHITQGSNSISRHKMSDVKYTNFCNVCGKGYVKKIDMKKHQIAKHPELRENIEHNEATEKTKRLRRKQSEITATCFCEVCNKGFTRKYDMQKHQKLKHLEGEFAEKTPVKEKRRSDFLDRCKIVSADNVTHYKCETCAYVFHSSKNLIRHRSIHTGIRPFFCHICGKTFRLSGGLARHITEYHYCVKKYKCDLCDRSFKAKATLDEHRNIHTNYRPFVCDTCGKAFKQKGSLHTHKLFHTDNFRFTCNVCNKKFRRATELKIHGWLHTGYKPHRCGTCNAQFRLHQDLKRHEKIHGKLNECVCMVCGSSFNQKRYLKNHMKTHKVHVLPACT